MTVIQGETFVIHRQEALQKAVLYDRLRNNDISEVITETVDMDCPGTQYEVDVVGGIAFYKIYEMQTGDTLLNIVAYDDNLISIFYAGKSYFFSAFDPDILEQLPSFIMACLYGTFDPRLIVH